MAASSEQTKTRPIDNLQLQEVFDIVKSTENHDIGLIWFDECVDDELKQTIEQLNGHVIICVNKDIFLDSIDRIQNETMIVIIAGKLAVDVLSIIHDNPNIDSIYLFCINKIQYLTLRNSYSKIVGIYTEYDPLLDSIKNKIKSLIQQLVTFSLFRQTEKSIRDLSRESGSFLWHQLAKEYLMNMSTSKTEAAKQEMLDLCRVYYQSNQSYLKKIDEFEQTYQPTDALKWYTKDTFLFRLLNKSLRCEDIELLYSFRYYLVDLCTCLRTEYDSLKDDLPSVVITLYRGQTLTDHEINKLKANVNQLIATNGFLSTSWSPDVARVFSTNVLYEINIDLSQDSTEIIRFANISQYSDMPSEREVLIELGASFKILNVQDEGDLCRVQMVSITKDQQIKCEFMDEMVNQISTLAWTEYYFGNLMIKIGQPTKALHYFENLIRRTTNNHRQQYIALTGLAHANVCVADYDSALNHMLTAYKLCSQTEEHVDSGDLAQILYSLAYMYSKRGDNDLAYEYYTRSTQTLPDQQKNQARNLIGMADVSCRQEKYDEALAFYELALDIETNLYPRASPYIASDLYHIARCHYHTGDYVSALDYLKQALEIQEQILPNTHVDIGYTKIYLGKTYRKLHNYEIAEEYCTEAFLIIEKLSPYDTGQLADLHFEIGICNAEKSDYHSSVSRYNQALILYEKHFSPRSEELAHVYSFMASAYHHSQQYDLEIEQCQKALMIYQQFQSIDTAKIIPLLWKLAIVYEQKQDEHLIIRTCQQLCSLYEEDTSVDLNQQTLLFRTIGSYYYKLGNYQSAVEYFQKALFTQEQSQEIQTAELHNNLGCCLTKLGQYKIAMEHCSHAKNLLKKHIETNCEHYGNVLNSVARIHYETMNYDQAYDYCSRSLRCFTHNDHPAIMENYDIVTNILAKKAHEQKRKKYLFIKMSIAAAFGLLMFQVLKRWFRK
ncbi:unnamed protein product [Adineta steineri]|uniref:NAD(P)(+)--arginine ADP-ribosyltransferase n=1 Tax=Adineta steineri TaxID=433720 RepID=A0A814TFH0_9BILA|nr:unnamed protein product [Adineta steineri]CAF1223553.1 unnamed protein product [Adineta steineri]